MQRLNEEERRQLDERSGHRTRMDGEWRYDAGERVDRKDARSI